MSQGLAPLRVADLTGQEVGGEWAWVCGIALRRPTLFCGRRRMIIGVCPCNLQGYRRRRRMALRMGWCPAQTCREEGYVRLPRVPLCHKVGEHHVESRKLERWLGASRVSRRWRALCRVEPWQAHRGLEAAPPQWHETGHKLSSGKRPVQRTSPGRPVPQRVM